MNPDQTYTVLFSHKDGQWSAYYDYGSRSPASVEGLGNSPEEALTNLLERL